MLFVQPFAWHAREALRKMIIGKHVKYIVEYNIPTIGRDFVKICTADGKDVAAELVAAGWARVRSSQQPNEY